MLQAEPSAQDLPWRKPSSRSSHARCRARKKPAPRHIRCPCMVYKLNYQLHNWNRRQECVIRSYIYVKTCIHCAPDSSVTNIHSCTWFYVPRIVTFFDLVHIALRQDICQSQQSCCWKWPRVKDVCSIAVALYWSYTAVNLSLYNYPHGALLLDQPTVPQLVKIFPCSMEVEGSSPRSQEPAICPYPETDEGSQCPPAYFLNIILILSFSLLLGLQVVSCLQVPPPKPCKHLSLSIDVLHAPAIILLNLIIRTIFGKEWSLNSLSCSLL